MNANKMKRISLTGLLSGLILLAGCLRQPPTGSLEPAGLALELRVAQWTLLLPDHENALARSAALAQVTRVEIYVTAEQDTLSRATVPIVPGQVEFSTSLEVPAGEDRRVIVEAWDDVASEGAAGLVLRGIQTQIDVAPEMVQTVPLTLYPVPITGRRVVLAAGPASGAPGSSSNLAPFTLVSADSLSGIQFDMSFDPALIAPQGVVPDAALPWSTVESNVVGNGQTLRVLMFDANARPLPAFYDPTTLARIDFRVQVEAAAGASSPLVISNALVLDANRNPLEVAAVADTFYVVGTK